MFQTKPTTTPANSPSSTGTPTLEKHERLFMRPGSTIEEEPDSVDSIISNTASFPITIVPAALFRSSTQASLSGRFSRQNSSR